MKSDAQIKCECVCFTMLDLQENHATLCLFLFPLHTMQQD